LSRRSGGSKDSSARRAAGTAGAFQQGPALPRRATLPRGIRALLRACSSRAPTGIRNRALIAVLYRGGLRISEALALHQKDVDQAAGTVTVLHGKGDQRRTVGMDPASALSSVTASGASPARNSGADRCSIPARGA